MFHYTIVSGAMLQGCGCDLTTASGGQTDGGLMADGL